MAEKTSNSSYRILCVITGCGGGDWPPLLALAAELHGRGHEIRVVCDARTVDSVYAAGLTAICLPQRYDLEEIFLPAVSDLLSQKIHPEAGGDNPLEKWGQLATEFVRKFLDDWQPSLVITSLLGVGLGKALAEDLSVQRCFLNPSFYFGHSSDLSWTTDFSQMGGSMYRYWLLPLTKGVDLVLHATYRDYDMCPTDLPAHHSYVGPIFWEKPGEVVELLQAPGPPWILITLSTSPQPGDLAIVIAALKTVESMDARVLVTLASGHDRDDLGHVPAHVYVKGYCPHSQVLPLCRLVISHSGHGIVMKAMIHGVPMVLVPWGRDQPGVALRASRLGIAGVVPAKDCHSEAMRQSIHKVFKDNTYFERSRLLSIRLGKENGAEKAAQQIEQLLNR